MKHDISVPVSAMPAFLEQGDALLERLNPEARLVAFGHVGDGNLHHNVVLPRSMDGTQWANEGKRTTGAIYDLVKKFGGSISAEHGIGTMKKARLEQYRSGSEMALMRRLKRTLDPDGILNPGKVI